MRFLSSILSFFYVACIFFLAGSPEARALSEFNPYSLLHIPLYGIMTFLLVFAMVPIPRAFKIGSICPCANSMGEQSAGTPGLLLRFFIAGAIALTVGILDEVHQLYVPGRDGSVSDVILDTAGILLALLLCSWFFKTQFFNRCTTP